jgi:hypothetical protein
VTDADVIVVGAGPVGLMLAVELRLAGVRTLVLERHPQIRDMPKAGGLSGQILEVLRYQGLLGRFEAASTVGLFPPKERTDPTPPFRLPFGGVHVDLTQLDPPPIQVLPLPQPQLERVLDELARELGAEIRRGQEVVGLHQDDDTVTAEFRLFGTDSDLSLDAPRLIIAGYTGRDAAAVAAHIEELAAIGIPPPASVPAFFELDPGLVTSDPVVQIAGSNTSGEVEPVLIRHNGRHYLGVGSDHTDRDVERTDIAASKAACPKPVSHQIVALPEDLAALHWDAIDVASDVDGEPYQRGSLAVMRTPTDLLSRLTGALGEFDGDLVMFCGTVPLLTGAFRAGRRWRLELKLDPNISLTHTYEVLSRDG